MDLSPEYIKMCNCEEIQNLLQRNFNDQDFVVSSEKISIEENWYKIWLPRQDQLQEMIDWEYDMSFITHKPNIERKRTHGTKFFLKNGTTNYRQFICDSFEKGLLQIIMLKKFNKTWNGEWVL